MRKKNRRKEEFYNTITHGIGAVLSVVALGLMLAFSIPTGEKMTIAVSVVFGISLVALYTASTCYHAMTTLRWKRFFKRVDHLCIYILIAGTYTPVALLGLKGAWGWWVFGLIWTLVVAGFFFKFSKLRYSKKLSLSLYLLMGWLIVAAIRPMLDSLSLSMLLFVLAGGACYTFGTFFYARERIPYSHAIWHVFVMGGSAFHFYAIFHYLIP
jgi:hemolysin III